MNKQPNISVVVPVYNSGKFLSETIESIRSQTLQNIEIIIVDDGSTDDSANISKNFALQDSRIKFLQQKNSGVSDARNFGMQNAIGEFIFFMDSDDTIDSEFSLSSFDNLKKNNSDIVVIGEYYYNRFQKVKVLPTWAFIAKKDFLLKNNLHFPSGIQPGEDGLFTHEIFALTEKVSFNLAGKYFYRQHEGQNHKQIKNNVDKVLNQIPKWFSELEDFYKDENFKKKNALHIALFLEHEPFEFRYLQLLLDEDQKSYLHKIIKDFWDKNVVKNLQPEDFKKISKPFLEFVKVDNHTDFDNFYNRFLKTKKIRKKFLLFLVNLVPNKKTKKQLREKINAQ